MKRLAHLASLFAVTSLQAQTTWYVDVHGAAPGSGTAADPYTSINVAIHAPATADGDLILVRPGVYTELVRLDREIVVRSTDGPLATQIRSTGTVADFAVFATSGLPVMRLEGFTLRRTGTGSGRVVRMVAGDLVRCIVIGNGAANGVYFEDRGMVTNCVITKCYRGLTEQQLYAYGGEVRSSIVWGNGTDSYTGLTFVCYSVIGTATSEDYFGAGVLRVPPGTFDLAGHDVHLLAGSPCIDSGDPAALDPDGSRVDIGVFPYDASYAPFEVYCTSKTNSLGCVPAIGASGTPSASSGAPFTITCANQLNQKLGLLFYGSAPHAAAYQGGYLCVHAPVRRTSLSSSGGSTSGDDCTGVSAFEFNALVASQTDVALVPGAEVFAQFWTRDPNASFTTTRSDALRFTLQP